MIWVILLIGAGLFAWFLLAPRRFQTLESIPDYVDKNLKAHAIIETTEDPREVRPITQAAANRAGDIHVPGHGDSLTREWPNQRTEPAGRQGGPEYPPQS